MYKTKTIKQNRISRHESDSKKKMCKYFEEKQKEKQTNLIKKIFFFFSYIIVRKNLLKFLKEKIETIEQQINNKLS